jgi:hypothetical protein
MIRAKGHKGLRKYILLLLAKSMNPDTPEYLQDHLNLYNLLDIYMHEQKTS